MVYHGMACHGKPWYTVMVCHGVPRQSWQCHGNAMALPWQCHDGAMALPWHCYGNAMALPGHSHGNVWPWHCGNAMGMLWQLEYIEKFPMRCLLGVVHSISSMVCLGIPWYTMVYHGAQKQTHLREARLVGSKSEKGPIEWILGRVIPLPLGAKPQTIV